MHEDCALTIRAHVCRLYERRASYISGELTRTVISAVPCVYGDGRSRGVESIPNGDTVSQKCHILGF